MHAVTLPIFLKKRRVIAGIQKIMKKDRHIRNTGNSKYVMLFTTDMHIA